VRVKAHFLDVGIIVVVDEAVTKRLAEHEPRNRNQREAKACNDPAGAHR
jgi:hypothetical protein